MHGRPLEFGPAHQARPMRHHDVSFRGSPRVQAREHVRTPLSQCVGEPVTPDSVPEVGRPHRIRFEVGLTIAALALTVAAAVLSGADIVAVPATRVDGGLWGGAVEQFMFLLIIGYLIYGACVYLVARVGSLGRVAAHSPTPTETMAAVYRDADPPLITVLVPSYREDERGIRRTLLCGALQTYPHRRVVLLIDDPPVPSDALDATRLAAARRLPGDIDVLLS